MVTRSEDDNRNSPLSNQRYTKGQSGNPRGRPKGAISTKLLTRKVALKRLAREVNGRAQRLTLLECVILAARAMAIEGHAGAAAIVDDLRSQMLPPEPQAGVGFLLVPELLTPAEWAAQLERHNAVHTYEPGTEDYEKYQR
jgi:hypothetical protein